MKKIIKAIVTILFVTCVIIFVGNDLIRVGYDSEKSIGIFEKLIFGKPIFEFLQPPWSENYKRWNSASKGSTEIADLLLKYGHNIVDDVKLEEIRLRALEISKKAYENAKEIDLDYLRQSNSALPEIYSSQLVNGLRLWNEGFSEKDSKKVWKGTESYNRFIKWIHSQKREDFKTLR